jgi:hypothetical protein
VNLVLSLPLRRSLSLSSRVCSVTPSCHQVSLGLSWRNALRHCRSFKATPRVQVEQTSSRNVTLSQDPFFAFLDLLSRFEPRTVLVQMHTRSLAMSQSLYYHESPQGSHILSRFVLDWLCFAGISYGLPLGPSLSISRTSPTPDVPCHVLCHVLVMCCVAPFCDVLRCSDTSIGVVGFVTHSRIREEL